jgi:hypothetical protein
MRVDHTSPRMHSQTGSPCRRTCQSTRSLSHPPPLSPFFFVSQLLFIFSSAGLPPSVTHVSRRGLWFCSQGSYCDRLTPGSPGVLAALKDRQGWLSQANMHALSCLACLPITLTSSMEARVGNSLPNYVAGEGNPLGTQASLYQGEGKYC